MYCHNCGTETNDHQRYCTECGAELVYQSSTPHNKNDTTTSNLDNADGDTEQSTDHQDHSTPSQNQSPNPEKTASETAQAASTTPAQKPDRSNQARELAANALFGYSFIILFRLTGISGLLFHPHAENPFFSTILHDIGTFIFYDGFLLAVIALIASAYLTARHYLTLDLPADTRDKLDTVATIGLSGSSLLYILGILFSLA